MNTHFILDLCTNGLSSVASPNIYLQDIFCHSEVKLPHSDSTHDIFTYVEYIYGICHHLNLLWFTKPCVSLFAVFLPLVRMGMLRGREDLCAVLLDPCAWPSYLHFLTDCINT